MSVTPSMQLSGTLEDIQSTPKLYARGDRHKVPLNCMLGVTDVNSTPQLYARGDRNRVPLNCRLGVIDVNP
jgi:hypothetical protein